MALKYGVVMEGGALRGVFTAGVTDELMTRGVEFDGAIGVSAGAIFGTNLKSKQIGRCIRFNTDYCNDPRYVSLRSFLKTGDLFGGEFCFYELTYNLDPFDVKAFADNPMEFYSVCTDVESGKPVYHQSKDGLPDTDMPWIRASATMPILARMVNIEGKNYMDGGIVDSIPIKFMEEIGYEKNVVIRTQPESYRMKPAKYLKLAKLLYKKYPNFIEAIANRYIMYNETVKYISQRQKDGAVFVFQPERHLISGEVEHDPEKLLDSYNHGREVVVKKWDEFCEWKAD